MDDFIKQFPPGPLREAALAGFYHAKNDESAVAHRTAAIGDPVERRKLIVAAAPSFMKFVDKQPDGCWIWSGGKNEGGYGLFTLVMKAKRKVLAHRYSWELHNEQSPTGKIVRHRCDRRDCVNPAHLVIGTAKDNAKDRSVRGRTRNGITGKLT